MVAHNRYIAIALHVSRLILRCAGMLLIKSKSLEYFGPLNSCYCMEQEGIRKKQLLLSSSFAHLNFLSLFSFPLTLNYHHLLALYVTFDPQYTHHRRRCTQIYVYESQTLTLTFIKPTAEKTENEYNNKKNKIKENECKKTK